MIYLKDSDESIIKKFYISEFSSDSGFREDIYNKKGKEKGILYCDCDIEGREHVKITISRNRKETIYMGNLSKGGEKHALTCKFHSKYVPITQHEKGWEKDEESGELTVNPSLTMFKRKKIKEQEEVEDDKEDVLENNHFEERKSKRTTKSSYKATLLGLMSRLNMMAWEDHCINKKKTSEDILAFTRQCYGTSKKIQVKKRKNLQDYYYSSKKAKEIRKANDKSELLFVFSPLVNAVEERYGKSKEKTGDAKVLFLNFKGDGTPWVEDKITCPTYMIKEAKKKHSKAMKKQDKNGECHTMVGGFVKLHKGKFEFVSIDFIPITKQGLWVESSYEKKVYESFCEQGILFSKGYEPLEYYNKLVPDIIFYKRLNPTKFYIGEIFGIENNEKYTQRKEEKLALARNSTVFDFWSVEAHNGKLDELPPVYS